MDVILLQPLQHVFDMDGPGEVDNIVSSREN